MVRINQEIDLSRMPIARFKSVLLCSSEDKVNEFLLNVSENFVFKPKFFEKKIPELPGYQPYKQLKQKMEM